MQRTHRDGRWPALAFACVSAASCGDETSLGAPIGGATSSSASASSSASTANGEVSSTAAGSSGVGTGTTSGSTAAGTVGDGTTTGGFELPEGCGDGVAVSDQYDCFYPIDFPELPGLMNTPGGLVAYPIDDAGNRALWLNYSDGLRKNVGVIWNGVGLEVIGEPQRGGGNSHFWHRDADQDGLPDLFESNSGGGGGVVSYNRALSGLERNDGVDPTTLWLFDYGAAGPTFPIDPDEDGELEFLIATEFPLAYEFRQFDRIDGVWTTVGAVYDMPGCGIPGHAAYGDFDEDGHEDVVVFDDDASCDPFPKNYDPTWHRATVLRGNPVTGMMEPLGSFAIGGLPVGVFRVADFTGDGHVDALFHIYDEQRPLTLAVGIGDGTFETGETPEYLEGFRFSHHGDLDGDGDTELLLERDEEHWVIDVPLDGTSVRKIGNGGWDLGILDDLTGDGFVDAVGYQPGVRRFLSSAP